MWSANLERLVGLQLFVSLLDPTSSVCIGCLIVSCLYPLHALTFLSSTNGIYFITGWNCSVGSLPFFCSDTEWFGWSTTQSQVILILHGECSLLHHDQPVLAKWISLNKFFLINCKSPNEEKLCSCPSKTMYVLLGFASSSQIVLFILM